MHEAIACHLEGLLMDGQPIPAQKPLEVHQGNKDFRNGIWALADFDFSKLSSKAKRVNITVPAWVLRLWTRLQSRKGTRGRDCWSARP